MYKSSLKCLTILAMSSVLSTAVMASDSIHTSMIQKASLLSNIKASSLSTESVPVLIKAGTCLINAEAKPDLATERFLIKAKSVSCDGQGITETSGYMVGSDGTAGMRFSFSPTSSNQVNAELLAGTEGSFVMTQLNKTTQISPSF